MADLLQYQAFVQPIFTGPEAPQLDKWYAPLSEPVRFARGIAFATALAASGCTYVGEPIEVGIDLKKWFMPLSEPTPPLPGLHPALQQFYTADPARTVTAGVVAALLADQDLPRAYLAHLPGWNPGGAAVVDSYFSSDARVPLFDGKLWKSRLLTALEIESGLGDLREPRGTMSGGRIELAVGDGDLDALFGYYFEGRAPTVYIGPPDGAFTDFTKVLTGQIGSSSWDANRLRAVLRDGRLVLQRAIQTSVYLGTGGVEGGADLKNRLKPLGFGKVRNAEPVITDQTNFIMQVHERNINAINDVFDRGVALTAAAGDAANYAALTGWTAVAGQYKTCLALGMLRLGARPDGPVTVDFEGEASGSYVSTAGTIIQRIVTWKASGVPAFDTAAFSTVEAARPWVCGLYLRDGQGTIMEAIDRFAISIGAWTDIAADGKLSIGIIAFGTAVLNLDENNTANFQAIETPVPPSKIRVGYQRSWLIQELESMDVPLGLENYNASNDQLATAVVAPTIASDGTAVDHTINTDSTADISFEWVWGGVEAEIDGFRVWVYSSTSATDYTFGTTPALETAYITIPSKRSFSLKGVPANLYYTFGVQAYRAVAPNINATGLLTSAIVKPSLAAEDGYQPVATITYSGGLNTGIVDTNALISNSVTRHVLNEDSTRRALVNVSTLTGGGYTRTDISFLSGTPDKIQTAAGDFTAAGFVANEVVYVIGSASEKNTGSFILTAVAAASMDVEESRILTAAAGPSITIQRLAYTVPYDNSTAVTVHTLPALLVDSTSDFIVVEFSAQLDVTNFRYGSADRPTGDAFYVAIYDGATQLYINTLHSTIIANVASGSDAVVAHGTISLPDIVDYMTDLSAGEHTLTLKIQPVNMHSAVGADNALVSYAVSTRGRATLYKR